MKLNQLKPSDFDRLKPFFSNQKHELCVYSLSSLLVWSNETFQPIGATDGNLFVMGYEFSGNEEKRHLILPTSPAGDLSPKRLMKLAVGLGFTSYQFVPEDYFENFGKDETAEYFKISENPKYEDYVYNTEALAELKGKYYSKKRNLISQFAREYISKNRVELETISPANSGNCIEFLEEWCEQMDCGYNPDDDLACEKQAAFNAIENIQKLDMKGIAVKVDNKVSAFGISSRLTEDMGVLHFEKAFTRIKGLYQYLDKECARKLFPGTIFINKESDMDIPGLAKSKQSYHPVKRIKSFTLELFKS